MSDTLSSSGLNVTYDRISDVLYVSRRLGVPARSQEESPGVVWRYDKERDELIGVTIIDFASYWQKHQKKLARQISSRFAVSFKAVMEILDSVAQ